MDTMLAAYLLNPLRKDYAIDELLEEFLDTVSFGQSPMELLQDRSFLLSGLAEVLYGRMEEEGLLELFRDVEIPLVGVLADMEFYGVKVDRQALLALSINFDKPAQHDSEKDLRSGRRNIQYKLHSTARSHSFR